MSVKSLFMVASFVFFLNAMFSVISPEKMFDGHINCTGFDDDLKAFALYMCRMFGLCSFMISGFFYTLASSATKEQTVAAGWAMLALGCFNLAATVSGDATTLGFKDAPLQAWTAFCVIWGFLILNSAGEKPETEVVVVKSLSTPFKVISVIFFINFCLFVFAPKMTIGHYIDIDQYKNAAASQMHVENMIRILGLFQFGLSRFLDASASSASYSCGIAASIGMFFFAANFAYVIFNRDFEAFKGDRNMILLWACVNAFFGIWIVQASGEKPKTD